MNTKITKINKFIVKTTIQTKFRGQALKNEFIYSGRYTMKPKKQK